jgi:Glycerol kinase
MNYIIIDQGTSSTKGFLFDSCGQILHRKRIKCVLNKPEKFHAESDPEIILRDIKELFHKMVNLSGNSKIKYTGISIQRSTFLFWEKSTMPACHSLH